MAKNGKNEFDVLCSALTMEELACFMDEVAAGNVDDAWVPDYAHMCAHKALASCFSWMHSVHGDDYWYGVWKRLAD